MILFLFVIFSLLIPYSNVIVLSSIFIPYFDWYPTSHPKDPVTLPRPWIFVLSSSLRFLPYSLFSSPPFLPLSPLFFSLPHSSFLLSLPPSIPPSPPSVCHFWLIPLSIYPPICPFQTLQVFLQARTRESRRLHRPRSHRTWNFQILETDLEVTFRRSGSGFNFLSRKSHIRQTWGTEHYSTYRSKW